MFKKNKQARKILVTAQGDERFWLADGHVLCNISELKEALKTMNAAIFKHHVGPGKNDFAAWLTDVLADEELAKRIFRMKTSKSVYNAVAAQLKKVY